MELKYTHITIYIPVENSSFSYHLQIIPWVFLSILLSFPLRKMRFCGSFIIFICILVIFCYGFGGVEGSRWRYVAQSAPIGRTIIVDQSGNGDFTKIQSAINSVPSGNTEWIRIIVRPGTYR